jgi:hypothetical protein
MRLICCCLGLLLTSCTAPSQSTIDTVDYKTIIARSLNYYAANKEPSRYSISEPWRPVVGGLMVCAREDIPDGKGGYAGTTNYSMYQFNDGRIVAMVKDNTLFGCPNRQYFELSPAAPR